MTSEELRVKRQELRGKSQANIDALCTLEKESARVANVASNAREILDDLDTEFERVTALNSTDITFMMFAAMLQSLRWVLMPELKLPQMEKLSPEIPKEERLRANERSHQGGIYDKMSSGAEYELEELKKLIASPVTTRVAGIDFVCGKIENTEVCAARCNPGKVNAALCTQLMLDRFLPNGIINLGVGCSLSKEVEIKNVVVATQVCQYDIDTTGCGDPAGFISGLGVINIEADKDMSAALALAAEKSGETVHRGTVATGDYFIASDEIKKLVHNRFGAICGEMEGGAVRVSGSRAELSDGTIAGSVTSLYKCMLNAADMGIPLEAAVRAATIDPCRAIGIEEDHGSIAPGKLSHLILLDRESLAIRRVIKE